MGERDRSEKSKGCANLKKESYKEGDRVYGGRTEGERETE